MKVSSGVILGPARRGITVIIYNIYVWSIAFVIPAEARKQKCVLGIPITLLILEYSEPTIASPALR